jgi:membrane-associated phospholipid phosphatase
MARGPGTESQEDRHSCLSQQDGHSCPSDAGSSPPSYWRFVIVGGVLVAAAAAAFSIDLSLARWFRDRHYPGSLGKLFDLSEVYGHGLGVAMILLAVHQFDRRRRWGLPRIVAGVLAAGLSADVGKLLVERFRPSVFLSVFPAGGSVWDTFVRWLPGTGAGFAGQSFPSGHAATAVGLAIGLGWLYPDGRRLLMALVVLVACQRMAAGAHFASDALGGAAIGCLGAGVVYCRGRINRFFARLEHPGWGSRQ